MVSLLVLFVGESAGQDEPKINSHFFDCGTHTATLDISYADVLDTPAWSGENPPISAAAALATAKSRLEECQFGTEKTNWSVFILLLVPVTDGDTTRWYWNVSLRDLAGPAKPKGISIAVLMDGQSIIPKFAKKKDVEVPPEFRSEMVERLLKQSSNK